MAATQQLNEYNGAGEVEELNVTHCNFGSSDGPNLAVLGNEITVGENSFEKWWKIAYGGTFNTIDNLKVWKLSGDYKAGEGIDTNAREASYGGAETYVQPTQTTSVIATEVMPVTEPSGANLGIVGSLAGQLSAPGSSDYLICQLQSTGSTPVGDANPKVFRFMHDES